VVGRENGKMVYEVSGLPGAHASCEVIWTSDEARLMLDGEPLPIDNSSRVSLSFPGKPKQLHAELGETEGKVCELGVDVPDGHENPIMMLLCLGPDAERLSCKISNNGRSIGINTIKPKQSGYFVRPGKGWQIFSVPLSHGKNHLRCEFDSTRSEITVKAAISADAPLVKRRVTMLFSPTGSVPKTKRSLPLLSPNHQKQVLEMDL